MFFFNTENSQEEETQKAQRECSAFSVFPPLAILCVKKKLPWRLSKYLLYEQNSTSYFFHGGMLWMQKHRSRFKWQQRRAVYTLQFSGFW